MAAPANTFVTDDAKGLREDLTDVIYDISPTKTPFTSMIGRDKMDGVLHEWQEDQLKAPDSANARAEGNDATTEAAVPTQRIGNVAQISDHTARVSGTLEKVRKAGRKSEMARQIRMRSTELKRDIETIALANQGADSSDPRKTAGILAFLKTNVVKAGDGVNPVYTSLPDDVRTDGTPAAFTETMLKSAVSLSWESGAEPRFIMVGAFNKSKISGFSGNADRVYNLNSAKPGAVIASVDVYVSEFGPLSVVPNRFQRARDALILDPEYLFLLFLRPYHTEELAKTGDSENRIVRAEWSLKVGTEKSQALVADLTTA